MYSNENKVKIHLNAKSVKQGHCLPIFVTSYSKIKSIKGYLLDRIVYFFDIYKSRIFRAIIGIDVNERPKKNFMVLKIVLQNGEKISRRISFKVMPFVFRQTTVTGKKYTPVVRYSKRMLALLKKRKKIIQERKYISRIYKKRTNKQYWEKKFVVPTKWLKFRYKRKNKKVIKIPREKPVFGAKRISVTPYGKSVRFHRGTDYSNIGGTPVKAAARGKVITARHLTARGKTIVIDHGHGVLTTYCHLRKILVKPNQIVNKAQKIAEMGTTGLSTGNHLHFELRVQGVSVTLSEWTKFNFYIPVFY
jgi:hypothetical protein